MVWEDSYLDKDNHVQYSACKVCGHYPAMRILFDHHEMVEEGPFCEPCWHDTVNKHFISLREKSSEDNSK